jgi:Ca2+-binding RTX toxin-like protein
MAIRNGTSESDTINGTSSADTINGLGGNDILNGLGGDDLIHGNDGRDTIDGGSGDNALFGDAGNDLFYVNQGIGFGVISGGTGTDTISFAHSAQGAIMEESIAAGYDFGSVENFTGSKFNDTLVGTTGNNTLNGGSGDDYLYGGDGNDKLDGGNGIDHMFGNAGSDVFYQNTFLDVIDGGTGSDTISWQKFTQGITAQFGNGESIDIPDSWEDAGGTHPASIEKLLGSQYADHLSATASALTIDGGGGNDVLAGEAWFTESTGIKMYGGAGNDQIYFMGQQGAFGTTAYGGGGNDKMDTHDMTGGTGADTFILQCSGDPLTGFSNSGAIVHDFHHSDGDKIDFNVDNKSTLSHSGDVWTVHDTVTGENFSMEIANVTSLSSTDYFFS